MVPNKPELEETDGLDASTSETPEPEITSTSDSSDENIVSAAAADVPEAASQETGSATPEEPAAADEESAPEPVSTESVADSSADDESASASTASAADSNAVAEYGGIKRGDVIEGTITETTPTSVTVDIGNGLTGTVPTHEIERMNRRMIESLKAGEPLTVLVVNPHDHNGNIVLSVNRALEELDWKRAEDYRQTQEVFESRVAGYNKGGLIVRFGRLRGFVPQSQMSAERRRVVTGETPEDRWGQMVNESIFAKVMEVDRSRNRLILSERSAARESREKRKENLISELTVGEVRTGRVVSLEDFGAFIDIGGAEGLVHLTEMSWQHINHPREMLKVGQEVKVEVISVDPDAKRIGLSMRRQAPDPWDTVATGYTVGQLVQASVTKLTKFGAFAQLVDLPEIEGLVHISELSDKRVTHPREVVQEGDKLTLRIVKMDIKDRRLGLSLKRVNSAEYLDLDWTAGKTDDES